MLLQEADDLADVLPSSLFLFLLLLSLILADHGERSFLHNRPHLPVDAPADFLMINLMHPIRSHLRRLHSQINIGFQSGEPLAVKVKLTTQFSKIRKSVRDASPIIPVNTSIPP